MNTRTTLTTTGTCKFSVEDLDSSAAYNPSTGLFTAPTAGTTFITTATIAPSLVGTWAYNTGDGTATTSCNWNGAMRCGYYFTSTPGSYTMGPPGP